jgi:hypothetical protein
MRAGAIIHLINPTDPPIAKVNAASWNGGTLPVAAVNHASSDQSTIARKPVAVAVFRVIGISHRDI